MTLRRALPAFWISNITDKSIVLSDINVRLNPRQSINLLYNPHYDLTLNQLLASEASGSLFQRNKEVVHRKFAPIYEPMMKQVSSEPIPCRKRSTLILEEIKYDELDISDDKFAEEAADLTDK